MTHHSKSPAHFVRIFAFGFLALTQIPLGAQTTVRVLLDAAHPGAAIPADFPGLSFEMQRVLADTNGSHFFGSTNRALIATFRTLGIKSLRVGGNTADRPTLPVPTESDVDNLFAFAKAADVKVIFTLRLNHGDPAADAAMAQHISQRYAKQLDGFAIGNEPNVFSTNFDVYLSEWKRFAAVIRSNVRDVHFCGPGVSPGHEKWSAQFASALSGGGGLKFISQHDYPGGDARKATNAAAARDKILSPAMDTHYAKFAANFVPVILSNGLRYRFEEANSFYDGGALGASDTFASALWALNYEWWWASHGISGINFHTGDKVAARDENQSCRYATFWTATNGYNIHPIGYAEKMFVLGSRGRLLPVEIADAPADLPFSVFAVRGGNHYIYVTLINSTHDATATNLAVQISANYTDGWRRAEILRLAAPGGDISAKTGVTLGGAEISDNARWNGHWEEIEIGKKIPVVIPLPAASAAIVKLRPRGTLLQGVE